MVGVSSSNTRGTCQAHAYRRSPPFMIVMTRQRSVLVWKAQASETMKRLCTRARIRFSTSAACTCQAHAKGTQLATVQPTAKDTPRTCRWHTPRETRVTHAKDMQVALAKETWVVHTKHVPRRRATCQAHMGGTRQAHTDCALHATHTRVPLGCGSPPETGWPKACSSPAHAKRTPSAHEGTCQARAKHTCVPMGCGSLSILGWPKAPSPSVCPTRTSSTCQAHAKIRTGRDNREDAKGSGKEHRGQKGGKKEGKEG